MFCIWLWVVLLDTQHIKKVLDVLLRTFYPWPWNQKFNYVNTEDYHDINLRAVFGLTPPQRTISLANTMLYLEQSVRSKLLRANTAFNFFCVFEFNVINFLVLQFRNEKVSPSIICVPISCFFLFLLAVGFFVFLLRSFELTNVLHRHAELSFYLFRHQLRVQNFQNLSFLTLTTCFFV